MNTLGNDKIQASKKSVNAGTPRVCWLPPLQEHGVQAIPAQALSVHAFITEDIISNRICNHPFQKEVLYTVWISTQAKKKLDKLEAYEVKKWLETVEDIQYVERKKLGSVHLKQRYLTICML